jgi:signal transduction histidine kinase
MELPNSRVLKRSTHARPEKQEMMRRDVDRVKMRGDRDQGPPKQRNGGEQPWNLMFNLRVVPATQVVPSVQLEDWQAGLTTIGSPSLSIIHDLRNPVATIRASAETLICVESLPHQIKRLATNIHSASERLNELLTDLREILSGNRPKAEICDIRDIITAASDAALAANVNNSVRMLHNLPKEVKVPIQRSRMQRVFFNLITNAIEAMPCGGEIRISASAGEDYVLVNIEDTGPGIPRRIRERLFEPFATADKRDGLGLGLALARQTVLDHGGEIWIEPAGGCRFAIHLPLH